MTTDRVNNNWHPPTELPDLRRVGVIALDLETRDNRLNAKMGSGWPFADGHICGVSVAYHAGADTRAHYFPLRHPDSNNFDPAQVYQWLRELDRHAKRALRLGMVARRGRYRDAADRAARSDRRARHYH